MLLSIKHINVTLTHDVVIGATLGKPARSIPLAFLNVPSQLWKSPLQPGSSLHQSTPSENTVSTYSTSEISTDLLYVTCAEGNVAPSASPMFTTPTDLSQSSPNLLIILNLYYIMINIKNSPQIYNPSPTSSVQLSSK